MQKSEAPLAFVISVREKCQSLFEKPRPYAKSARILRLKSVMQPCKGRLSPHIGGC